MAAHHKKQSGTPAKENSPVLKGDARILTAEGWKRRLAKTEQKQSRSKTSKS